MTTSLMCPHCDGRGHGLTDVLVGVERGQPLFERRPAQCEKCSGRGVLYRHARGRAPLPYPT